jgi:hypothetical protein
MYPKEVLMFEHLYIPLLEAAGDAVPRREEHLAAAKALVSKNLGSDESLRKEYDSVLRSLEEGSAPGGRGPPDASSGDANPGSDAQPSSPGRGPRPGTD